MTSEAAVEFLCPSRVLLSAYYDAVQMVTLQPMSDQTIMRVETSGRKRSEHPALNRDAGYNTVLSKQNVFTI